MAATPVTTRARRAARKIREGQAEVGRPIWGAGLCLAVALAVTACSSGSSASTAPVSAAAPSNPVTTAAVTTVPARTGPAPAASAAPPAAAPDPTTTLKAALDALTGTYHFVSTVTLDGAVALVADGDRVGDGSRLTLTSKDGTASYLITPTGSWVMPEGGEWQQVDADPASADPIGALRTPTAVKGAATDGSTAHLDVTVPPAVLGVPGDAPVDLDVAVTSTVLSSVTYATTVGGKPATVTATFGPAQDASPVVPPS
jgi:hypothetical protein